MDLLERYLQAVQFWLPKKQKQDIIAELSEDLRSQIDEKESELGRKLQEGELEAILKRCGPPLVVASHYRPAQYLIGPVLFPFYRFVMAIALFGCVVPRTLLWIGLWIFDPARRGSLQMDNLLTTAVYFAFAITMVFTIIERTAAKTQLLEGWNPRKLPAVRDPNRISRAGSIVEIAFSGIFLVWFVGALWPGKVIDLLGPEIMLVPVWQYFFWTFLALGIINIEIACVNFVRPYWTPLRASLRAGSTLVGGMTFCWLMKAQVLAGFSAPDVTAQRAAELTGQFNAWLARSAPWAIVGFVVVLCFDIYRIIRLRKSPPLSPERGVLAGA